MDPKYDFNNANNTPPDPPAVGNVQFHWASFGTERVIVVGDLLDELTRRNTAQGESTLLERWPSHDGTTTSANHRTRT